MNMTYVHTWLDINGHLYLLCLRRSVGAVLALALPALTTSYTRGVVDLHLLHKAGG